MIDLLRDLPAAQLAAVVCLSFVLFTWLGIITVRPLLRRFVQTETDINGVVSNFVSIYGVFYGILMGLLAVAAYQNRADVGQAVAAEGTSLYAVFRSANSFPEAVRVPLQTTVRDYVQFVIDKEWPAMRKGEFAQGGMPVINKLQGQLAAFEPATPGQQIMLAETTRQFYTFLEHRAVRLYSVTTGIPGIMWSVVLLGAVISIFFIWLFDMTLRAQFLLGGLMSFFIGAMISLIVVLDSPLKGEFGLSPEVFQLLLGFMNKVLGNPAG
jgi:hypothetical protein